jgi:hypothetical protein
LIVTLSYSAWGFSPSLPLLGAGASEAIDLRFGFAAQIDCIRRDSERLFKHGERMIGTTSKLFSNRPES